MTAAQLAAEVRRAATDTPYVVVDESPEGFALQVDVVDARWWSLYQRNGLTRCWRWEVRVTTGGTYSIADREATMEWQGGAGDAAGPDGPRPTLRFASSVSTGSIVEVSSQRTYGVTEQGGFGKVVDYRFDSREGRALVTEAAQRLGLRSELGTQARIGLTVAAVVLAGVVLGGIGLAVLLVVLL